MRGLGIDEARIDAIPHWQVVNCDSAQERAVLAYVDCLALSAGRTPDAGFDALQAFLSGADILEVTSVVWLYDMHAVMSRALRVEWDDRDDRSVEVAAPEGFSARDFLDTGRR